MLQSDKALITTRNTSTQNKDHMHHMKVRIHDAYPKKSSGSSIRDDICMVKAIKHFIGNLYKNSSKISRIFYKNKF